MRRKLVAGNWKMNGGLETNAVLLGALSQRFSPASVSDADVAVFAPFPYLGQIQAALKTTSIQWGAQSVSEFEHGAYTGEVSASMLREFGCSMVIVGHSERRALFGESDAQVAAKAAAAVGRGLMPVICLGETLAEREAGATLSVVGRQLSAVTSRLGVAGMSSSVLAYEPVWAIGTGRTATAGQVQEVHAALRQQVAELDATCASGIKILYGGSVKASNASELFALPDVDGALVGGASLVAQDFLAICDAARDLK